jgi:hypothetical protein
MQPYGAWHNKRQRGEEAASEGVYERRLAAAGTRDPKRGTGAVAVFSGPSTEKRREE